nr:MAG TPA: endosialidase chaperone [Caudoviricetes sp.]
MRTLSEKFKELQAEHPGQVLRFIDLTLKDGTVLHLTNHELWNNGFQFEDAVSGESEFEIGSVIVNQCVININNMYDDYTEYNFEGAEAVCYLGMQVSETQLEKIRICTMTVVDAPYQNSSVITLTCYDNARKFDRDYSESTLKYPATRSQIIRDACTVCGVTLGTPSFYGADFVVPERPADEALTFRQVLAWTAQLGCQWIRCNAYGQLCVGWYDLEPKTFSKISSTNGLTINIDQVVITGVRVAEYSEDQADDEVNEYLYGKEGYVLSLTGNRLITKGTGKEAVSRIGQKCVGMSFWPFSGSELMDIGLEAGDAVKITDRKGRTYQSYVTVTTLKPGEYQSVACNAKSAARNSAKRYSELTQAYVSQRRQAKKEKTQWENELEGLSKRLNESPGLYTTEEADSDGGKIFYWHNKPNLKDSDIIWKMTAEACGVSTDGGKTWNTGLSVDGRLITKIMSTIGLNFSWGVGGELIIKNSDGTETMYVNAETGEVRISASAVSIKGESIDTVISRLSKKILDDFVDGEYADNIKDIENSLDKKAESWYQENDPSVEWTATEETYLLDSDGENILDGNGNPFLTVWEKEKSVHEGDLWKVPSTGDEFIYISGNWVKSKVPDDLFDFIDGKAQIFVNTPVPPYNVGDLWFGGADADIMTCVRDRRDGEFSADDWEKKNKYTDDSAVDELNKALDQEEIFNRLTNNGEEQGIYLLNRKLYINFSFARGGILKLGGKNNGNGEFHVYDENDELIGSWTNKGFSIDKAESVKLGDFFNYDSNGNINGQADVFITMGGWQIKQTTVYDEPAEYWETIGTQENGIGAKGPWVVWGGWNGLGAFNKDNYNFVVTEDGTCKAMSWVTGSKAEWKEDIHAYEDGALEKINNTTVYRYKLKRHSKDEDGRHIGFVIGDGFDLTGDILDHDKSNIDMYNALGVAYKAIQELSKEVSKLKEKLKRYESEE